MQTIRAAVCHAFGEPLRIEDVRLAAPAGRAVEVTLEACAICHSDISFAEGIWGGTLPAVYGHEAAGRITKLGEQVSGFSLGDKVIVTLIRSCGTCAACASGQPTACTAPGTLQPLSRADGSGLHAAMNSGAFAEKVVVDQSQIAKVPEQIPSPVASLLSCGVITGIGAVVNAAKLRTGQDAVVIGAGGVGLNTIQGARIAGARRIVAVDIAEEKLNDALDFGATDVILATADTPWRQLVEKAGRKADAVFVTVGAIQAYDTAPNYLAPGGNIVMVGMPASDAVARYSPDAFASQSQGMIGSKMGNAVLARDIPWLVDLYMQGRLKLDELVSRHWTLDQINDAIADTKSGNARRNVIVFDDHS